MPKIRTNRSAAKRFSRTGSGKLRRRHAYASHLLSGKSPKRKRRLRKSTLVSAHNARKVGRLLPNR